MKKLLLLVSSFLLHQSVAFPNGCVMEEPSQSSEDAQIEYVQCIGSNFTKVTEFCRDKSVLELSIKDCNPQIPQLKQLPNMTVSTLKIVGCGIEEIDDDAFESVNSVTTLHLTNNKMIKLPMIGQLTTLRKLVLSNNKISHIPEGSFQRNASSENETSFNLESLYLNDNNLTEITNSTFLGLKNIETLHLDNNQIRRIATDAFANVNISILALGNNNLTKLTPGMFEPLKQLTGLSLNGNQLNELPSDIFAPLKNLSILTLTLNNLEYLSSDMMKGLEAVNILDLSNNKLKKLDDDVFHNMPKIFNLSLAHNQLTNLSSEWFAKAGVILRLDLQNNKIKTLPKDFVSSSPALNELFLNDNRLQTLNRNSFSWSPPELIDLRNNNLTTVSNIIGLDGMDMMFNQLFGTTDYHLLLEGNPLVCDDKMKWLAAPLADDTLRVNRVCATVVPTCVAPIKHAGKSLKNVYVNNDKKRKHQKISKKLYG